uniref:DNA2/NAM7 helicase-like C-terminal domain-containing protein n=1 Tax=Meloidogyne floridensis TaxID=298350 RepID=A0A915NY16_9BILA
MSNSTSHLLVTAVDEEELIKALKPTEEKKGKSHNTRHFGRKWAGSLLPSALLDVQHAEPEEDAHNGSVRVGFGLDSVIINLDDSDGIVKTALQIGYRSHPHIVQCIKAEFYHPHGRTRRSPHVFIQPSQTWTALRILWRLINVLPPDSSIRCICLYGTQANDIEREVQAAEELNGRVLVTIADATQGYKADVTVVVTTISEFQKKSGEGKEPFWCDPDRLNVSLSRARYELVLTGNLHILEQKKGWEEFLAEAKQKTIVVGQDYLDVIRMEGAQHNQEGELATGKNEEFPQLGVAHRKEAEENEQVKKRSFGNEGEEF